jgi:hypothetical protein
MDALKALPNVLREHSGHTTVYLVLSVPSVMEERLFFELHGFWKTGLLQSSFHGLVDPVLAEKEAMEKVARCETAIGGTQCYLLKHGDDTPHRSITSGVAWTTEKIDKVLDNGMDKASHKVRLGKRQGTRTKKANPPHSARELPLEPERGDVRRVGSGEVSLAIPDKAWQQTYEWVHTALAAISAQSGDGPPQLHLPGVVQPETGVAFFPPDQSPPSVSDSQQG